MLLIGLLSVEASSRHGGSDCLRPILILFKVKLKSPAWSTVRSKTLFDLVLIPWFIISNQTIYSPWTCSGKGVVASAIAASSALSRAGHLSAAWSG